MYFDEDGNIIQSCSMSSSAMFSSNEENKYGSSISSYSSIPSSSSTLKIIDPTLAKVQPPEQRKEKNPLNLRADQVLALIRERKLLPGPPPDTKRYSSKLWEEDIIFFLYDSKTGVEIKHWYCCAKCNWVHNCILGGGNKRIRDHVQKHKNEQPYSFDRIQLASLLANATKFGALNGNVSIEDFTKHLPLAEKW